MLRGANTDIDNIRHC